MNKIAIVTGASRGIGLEISKKLNELNYKVFGIARNFSDTKYDHPLFTKFCYDLLLIEKYEEDLKFLKNSKDLSILVNCAGIGLFGLHEELKFSEINKMLTLNFISPILLTKLFLRDLKNNKGYIFNISSSSALQDSALASAYSASKAGLTQFGNSIFLEGRKNGLKVINIHPDITESSFYERNWFKEDSSDDEAFLKSEEIANTIEFILQQRDSTIITNITIKPQKHKIKKIKTNL
jgi:short-subunit dehydrogenase